MPTSHTLQRLAFAALLFLGLMARLSTAKVPLLDHHSWRQADTASIARNFLRERFNPLYPQVDWRGAADVGYVETGFELHAFLVAAIAKLIGFNTDIGRFLSCFYFAGSIWLLHGFLRRRYGAPPALWGAAAYAFGFALPFFIDRTFLNEPLLLLLTFGACRAAQASAESSRRGFVPLLVTTTLIALIKPVYLVYWAGILALFWERDRRHVFPPWQVAGILAVNVAALALWMLHAHALYQETGLTFGNTDKLFDAQLLLSLSFWGTMARRLALDILGPLGAVLAVVGLAAALRRRAMFEPAAVLGFVAYLIIVTVGNAVHDYYQMVALPVGAVLVGLGLHTVAARGRTRGVDAYLRTGAVLLAVMILSAFLRSINSWYGVSWEKEQVCNAGRQQLPPDARVVLASSDSNPDLLFCLDRKGWIVGPSEVTRDRIGELRHAGARGVLIQTGEQAAELTAALGPDWTVIAQNRRYLFFAYSEIPAH